MDLQSYLKVIQSHHPNAIDLGLERVSQVARRLGLDSFSCQVITVAGTNGKGSTIATIEAVTLAAGLRVAKYTSPHLLHFNERICINGEMATDEAICEAFQAIDSVRQDITLTYFEYATLAALKLFADAELDIMLLEVGMGGRLDAVNIVSSDIAIITNIDLDHTEWLGDTREAIAIEKAGILREQQPFICGDPTPPIPLQESASHLECQYYQLNTHFHWVTRDGSWDFVSDNLTLECLPYPKVALVNAATALQAINLLQTTFAISVQAIKHGLATVFVPGRVQQVDAEVKIILDVAHNPASVAYLAEQLASHTGVKRAVFSMLATKDVAATLETVADCIDEWYVAPLEVESAASIGHLEQALVDKQCCYQLYDSIASAYATAKKVAQPGETIVVFGSFFTVAKVMEIGI